MASAIIIEDLIGRNGRTTSRTTLLKKEVLGGGRVRFLCAVVKTRYIISVEGYVVHHYVECYVGVI
jgi:hypothetical protein